MTGARIGRRKGGGGLRFAIFVGCSVIGAASGRSVGDGAPPRPDRARRAPKSRLRAGSGPAGARDPIAAPGPRVGFGRPRAFGPRPEARIFRTPGSTWRRPALPPLGGQYPGRGAVSRPSSEWGRVVPARCDHQVEPEVRCCIEPFGSTLDPPATPCQPPTGGAEGGAVRSREAVWAWGATLPGGWQGVGGGFRSSAPQRGSAPQEPRAWGWVRAQRSSD